jgi:cation diffusion facilitator CzcD-associated flavoprotein CzcO
VETLLPTFHDITSDSANMGHYRSEEITESVAAEIEAKYIAERDKRLQAHPEGPAQFTDFASLDKFKHFQTDPWVDPHEPATVPEGINLAKGVKYLIVGTGYSGLLFAVRFLEAGVALDDLVLVDPSGGYGGVWYRNRYPGLMCDVESYIYMPLLEETGYMPKHKYSYGPELRGHANRIADRWNLRGRTIFRHKVTDMEWDAARSEWQVKAKFVGQDGSPDLTLRAHCVLVAGGQLFDAKIPAVPGIDTFQGHMFHTSRWDYDCTGGSAEDAHPEMVNLKDKAVGIIGTGATSIQTIPELAKHAKQLFVMQRTPSSVDERNQQETDPAEWQKITASKGWWWDRNVNFAKLVHQTQPPPDVNMVSDNWVMENPSYCTAWGCDAPVAPDQAPQLIARMHAGDLPRAERLRGRVDQIVQDKKTAESLKHWYPSWCKRPCFHDDYLPTFNRPNVTLLETGAGGVERFTEKGVVVNGTEYELDVVVLATGYKVPGFGGDSSAAGRYGINIVGKDGTSMPRGLGKELGTLHGLCSAGFPNMFFMGGPQASLTVNQIMSMDSFARHIAGIVTEGQRMLGSPRTVVESTKDAERDWGDQIAALAVGSSAMLGCTPSYLNAEGNLDKILAEQPEEAAEMMRHGLWARGILHYLDALDQWKKEGPLKGFTVTAAA